VENVLGLRENGGMADKTIGTRLRELKKRTKLTLDQIAELAGYAGRSSVQEFFKDHYDPAALDAKVAHKLEQALVGRGQPTIEADEIWSLVTSERPAVVPTEDELLRMIASLDSQMPIGLPRAEWIREVSLGLQHRLALYAKAHAALDSPGDPDSEAPAIGASKGLPSA